MPLTTILPDTSLVKVADLTFNMGQAGGTYDIGTVSGGDIEIIDIAFQTTVAALGLTSVTVQTNNAVPDTLLASVLLAALLAGANATPFTGKIRLASGKKIQGTVVGTGSAGTMKVSVRYQPLAQGALIA